MALDTDGSLNLKRDVPMSSIITVILQITQELLTRFKTRHFKGKSEDTPQELKTTRKELRKELEAVGPVIMEKTTGDTALHSPSPRLLKLL